MRCLAKLCAVVAVGVVEATAIATTTTTTITITTTIVIITIIIMTWTMMEGVEGCWPEGLEDYGEDSEEIESLAASARCFGG